MKGKYSKVLTVHITAANEAWFVALADTGRTRVEIANTALAEYFRGQTIRPQPWSGDGFNNFKNEGE